MRKREPYDEIALQEIVRRALSRRQFLGRTAVAAGGLAFGSGFLSACARKEGGAVADSAKTVAATATGTVKISNWPLYIDKETVAQFEQATGIKAEYTEDVNDNNEFFAKIDEPLKRGQSIDRDLVVLTDWMAGRLIKLGYVQAIPEDKFPNKANLVDSLRDVGFDPGRKFSMPWLSGMTGVGYNPKKTGRELTSVNDIFDPKFKGQVTMLTEMRDTLGLVMLGLGKDPTKCTVDDAKAACAKIKKHRENGHIRKFTGNDYAADLAQGNIAAAIAWSGDIQGLAADNPELRWIAPKEGAMLFSDNMLIPKTAARPDLAAAWMNYVYDPAHSAQIVTAAPYISAVKGAGEALAKLDPELAKSPLVNPPDDLRARLHVFKWLEDAEDQEFNRLFQDAIGA
jgi:spermidine/putrescine transport system substrate-binding protein